MVIVIFAALFHTDFGPKPDKEENHRHYQQCTITGILILSFCTLNVCNLTAGQSHQDINCLSDTAVIIILAEMRNDVIFNDTLAICVRYCTLESVTYLDGNLSTCVRSLGLHENYDTVIEILGTYTPFNTDLGGIFSRRISFQISNGDDSNLVGSSVTECLQLLLKFIDLLLRENRREVIDKFRRIRTGRNSNCCCRKDGQQQCNYSKSSDIHMNTD